MNAATRRPIPALRRGLCGSLTAALLVGGSWGLASPAAATTAAHTRDPLPTGPFVYGEPFVHGKSLYGESLYGEPFALGDRLSAGDLPGAGDPLAAGEPVEAGAPFAATEPQGQDHTLVHGNWPAGPPGTWMSPVSAFRVSAPYGVRGDWKAGHHTGIDLAVPVGTPVRSVGSGKVVSAGWSGAYGKTVTVRMDDGYYTLFAHLSEIHVEKGDRVKAGTLLGESGATGRATGPHLHFEVRSDRDYGTDVNPGAYLEEHGVSVF